jgi:16S rRNA (cytosine1402-N4)-methyltransferase
MSAHIPVMLSQVLEHITPKDGAIYIDCTFGAGGYSRAILQSCNCRLYSIDQDPTVIEYAKQIESPNFHFINQNFVNLHEIAEQYNLKDIDAIVFDLGVSSMQLDQAERGFSFNKEARLDMRMSKSGIDAWEVINKYTEEDLADIIYYYGEETFARRIARKIVETRKVSPINTTIELAKLVASATGKKYGRIDPATKTFQAIRIYINDELKVLKQALKSALEIVKVGGKIIVVTFQGLEDRIVKDFVAQSSNVTAKLYKPTDEEIKQNPRSRSAKLRCLERVM